MSAPRDQGAPTDAAESPPHAAAAADLESTTDSLYEQSPADEDTAHRPGKPISRTAPFYRGFIATLGVLAAVLLGVAVREAESVLVLVVVSVFLAVGLNPIVEFMIRHGMRRRWAVLILAVAALGVIALVAALVVGVLRTQVARLIDDLPHLIDDLRHNKTIRHLDQRYHFLSHLQKKLDDPNLGRHVFGGALNVGLTVLGALVNAIVIFVLTLYLLAALPAIKHHVYSLAPASRRARVAHLGDEILHRVGGYVVGAVLVALLAGTVTFVTAWAVGLGQYAVPLATLVAILDLVPLVGSVIGAGTVTILGFATSLHVGVTVLIIYLVYEPLEGYVIYPRVMRSSVDVPEFVTIIAVMLGGALAGVVGALLALPIAAAALLLVREVWVRRQDAA